MQVKLIWVMVTYHDEYSQSHFFQDISDWEDISEKELEFLKNNLWRLHRLQDVPHGFQPLIVVKDEKPVLARVEGIKALIEDEKAKRAKEAADAAAKKALRAAKRKAQKDMSEIELLQQLAEKHNLNVVPTNGKNDA